MLRKGNEDAELMTAEEIARLERRKRIRRKKKKLMKLKAARLEREKEKQSSTKLAPLAPLQPIVRGLSRVNPHTQSAPMFQQNPLLSWEHVRVGAATNSLLILIGIDY